MTASEASRDAAAATSIIIPLYNKAEYTEACLVALAAVTQPGTYELVLVDNGSTDGTGALLGTLGPDSRIIRNPTNLGFAKACNQGAAVATGRHLVFLNNDTEPHPGWLEPLVQILDSEPDVGIVGAKLLFPDGLVQHAGVWMVTNERWDSLDGYHRLYRTVPDDPLVNERADLPAVTGACMAVRREAFTAAGGFDEAYWNGNEDVELCLRARAAGYRVVYDPRSTLTHHESVSGPERFSKVEENRKLLADRWLAGIVPDARWHFGSLRAAGPTTPSVSPSTVAAGPLPQPTHGQRPAAARQSLPVVDVVGYLGRGSGPDAHTAQVIAMLDAARVPHNLALYHRSFIGDAAPAVSHQNAGGRGRILIVCVEPDAIDHFASERGAETFHGRFVVASWAWPHPEVPAGHAEALQLAHEFWVSNPALRSWMAARVPGEAVLVRTPMTSGDRRGTAPRQVRADAGLERRFTFTALADLVSADRGEAALSAIRTFTEAFAPPAPHCDADQEMAPALLVGISGAAHLPWRACTVMAAAGGRPDVFFVDLDVRGVDHAAAALAGDCHLALAGVRDSVTPSIRAMAAGLPVVTMSHPANLDVVSAANSYVFPEAGRAVEAIRRAAANREDAARRGKRAARDVTDRHPSDRVAKIVRDRLRRASNLLALLDGQAS
ncbi:MAG TPA: glycosyltransferase family 2 protein [Acidimicrobiales bacterium]|nr:glycosyltransferase family 2 protein [Acidimicrobiales bacterium]